MKTFKIILFAAITLFLTGCEDTIHVDLDTAAPKLVIDASIDWTKNTPGNEQKIKLSTTTDYYNSEFPTVSGATITVTNSANIVFPFIEKLGTGEYICSNFIPEIGETYTLKIIVNGETYTASETLVNVPKIEDQIDQNNKGGMAGDEVEITYYYQDNGAQNNYYLSSIITQHVAFPIYEAEDDENKQGNLIPAYYSNKDFKPGDLVNIKLYGMSKRYYEYYNKLITASGNDGNPFQTTPTAVRGNIVNQTNSKNFAYGYFKLSEVDSKDYTVQ